MEDEVKLANRKCNDDGIINNHMKRNSTLMSVLG